MQYLIAFVIGGAVCAVGQLLIDFTKLTPARILVTYVVLGVILSGCGLYQPFVDFAQAGATVPLTGFGHLLAKGVLEDVEKFGLLGAFHRRLLGFRCRVSCRPFLWSISGTGF